MLIGRCPREKVVINRRVLACLINSDSQVSVISEVMVRSVDLRVIPVNQKFDLKTANYTIGQVITDIILWVRRVRR